MQFALINHGKEASLTMNNPNIFRDFATKELAQDAALAYILAWADPRHKNSKSALNALGEDLLYALLNKTKKVANDITIEKVKVATQDNRIDISVRINDSVFLIIEDKVHTSAHTNQIERYKASAEESKTESGNPWKPISAVYLKTGNECKADNSPHADGLFFRPDLLAVLNRHTDTGNDIINEFRQHLQRLEDKTNSFSDLRVTDWSWEGHKGYFGKLETKIKADELWWGYASNPAGGSLIFYWNNKNWRNRMQECNPFLQIDHLAGFFVRVWKKGGEKVYSDTLWKVLEKTEACAESIAGIHVKKPKRFGAGYAANAAQIYFDGDDLNSGGGYYIATKDDGTIDLNATAARIKKAEQLLDSICK